MPNDAPLISWLDHLWQLYPAQGVLLVGAGNGASAWIEALQNWNAPNVMLVEADETQFQHLQRSLAATEGWQLRKQVVAREAGSVTFHQASNPAESGLLEPETLRALWPNLKTRHKSTRQSITLAELLPMTTPGANWLLLDCLPAAPLLAGAGAALDSVDVILTRALLPEPGHGATHPGADASAVAQWLQAHGFCTVATQTGRHPNTVHTLHVRDRSAQLQKLTAELAELRQAQHAAEQTAQKHQALLTEREAQAKTLQQELTALQQQLAESTQANIAADTALQTRDAQLNTLQNELAQARQTAEQAKVTVNQHQHQVTQLQAEANELRETAEKARADAAQVLAQAREAQANATKELQERDAELKALQTELAQAKQAAQQASDKATHSQQQLTALQIETTQWREAEQLRTQKVESTLENMERALEQSATALNEKAAQLGSLLQKMESIQAQLDASKTKNSELCGEVGQLQQSLHTVESALELAKNDAAQAIERAEQLKTDVSTLTTDKTTLQKRATDLQRQVDQTMGRLAKLQLAHQLQARSLDSYKLPLTDKALQQQTAQPLCRLEPVQTASVPLGDAWSGNTINTVLFRHHGLLTWKGFQFTAFYADDTTLRFVSRRLSDNDLKTHDVKGDFNLMDAHNNISMGVDNKGFLHVCFDHHASKLRYRRSLQPLSVESWTDDLPMTGMHEDKVTYPTFILPRAGYALTLLYRDGTHNRGSARLKYYDETKQVWRDKGTPILSGVDQKPWTSNAYWNHPAIGTDGSLHLSFVWRTGLIGEDQLVNNINLGYAWSPDNGHHWYSLQGQPYQVPITPVTAETIWPTPPGSNLINQCSMALDRYNMPHIAFYGNDAEGIPQYQHLWHDGKAWHHQFVSCRRQHFQLRGGGTLQIPISRPEILVDQSNDVFLVYRGDLTGNRMVLQRLAYPDYSPDPAGIHIIAPDDLGFSEPIIDRTLWSNEQRLSILLQHNEQPDGDRDHTVSSSPVRLVDLNLHP